MTLTGEFQGDVVFNGVFAHILDERDALRATEVVELLLWFGLRCALTGGLAIRTHLLGVGRASALTRTLNDIDLVVSGLASIPASLADAFLLHHVHPDATDGRTLLQLVDADRALRIDLFLELGSTLSRAVGCGDETGELPVVSVEDLTARTTAFVFGRLRRGKTIDRKHVTAFHALRGLGRSDLLDEAWQDHRQTQPGTIDEASRCALRLLDERPELVVVEAYPADATPCDRCRPMGAFLSAPRARIVEILGYC